MKHFCTYFDANYLARGLALHRSLTRHAGEFTLYVLAMDEATERTLHDMKLPGVRVIPLAEFERGDAPLAQAKANRSRVEYYFTCTPSLPGYIMDHFPGVDRVTYLDADLWLFASPEPLLSELADGAVLIVSHRFPPGDIRAELHGIYNVGWLTFRNDARARACLAWWRERCLAWCYDRVEAGRYADQKYLDDWPRRFPGVVETRLKGAGLAPWNVGNHALSDAGGALRVDGEPVIFYHFHGLRWVGRALVDPGLQAYVPSPGRMIRKALYAPYIRELRGIERSLRCFRETSEPIQRYPPVLKSARAGASFLDRLNSHIRNLRVLVHGLRKRQLWLVVGDRVW